MIGWYMTGSYALGSIPTGYWLGKAWKGLDVRRHGSGNLGATNVYRVLGRWPAITTLVIDIFKGWFPVRLVETHFPGALGWAALAGLFAIVGHVTSPWVGFKGGKGVATSAGAFIALLPIPAAMAIATFLVTLIVTRIVSVSSILSVVALAASAFWWAPDPRLAYAALAVSLFIIWTHRANIRRLRAGTEPRMSLSRKENPT